MFDIQPTVAARKTSIGNSSIRRFAERSSNVFTTTVGAVLGLGDDVITIVTGTPTLPWRAKEPFVTLDRLAELCEEEPAGFVVEDLLPMDEVHVAVGDSGLGKTPWAYQLGLCVASGRPFLNRAVSQGRVVYFDLENGQNSIVQMSGSICDFLKVDRYPADFLVLNHNGNVPSLAKTIENYKPALVIVDTLRALHPESEKNDAMAKFLSETRKIARENHCAILLLHHVRKPGGERAVPKLQDTLVLEWLYEASGARALINLTHTRIAFQSVGPDEEAAFVMKCFVKLAGETGPFYVGRVCDDDGEPIGYRTLTGLALLRGDQLNAFNALPEGEFGFREGVRIYGRTDDPTSKWLKKCMALDLLRQVRRGIYQKKVRGNG
jgi:hypothetical protein